MKRKLPARAGLSLLAGPRTASGGLKQAALSLSHFESREPRTGRRDFREERSERREGMSVPGGGTSERRDWEPGWRGYFRLSNFPSFFLILFNPDNGLCMKRSQPIGGYDFIYIVCTIVFFISNLYNLLAIGIYSKQECSLVFRKSN